MKHNLKVGDILIAKDECLMEETNEKALIIGKKYKIKGIEADYFYITSELGSNHCFYLADIDEFFDIKNERKPALENTKLTNTSVYEGLTKRGYFAGLAMQGILANNDEILLAESAENIAKISIKFADALLKQLNQNK